MNELDYAVIGVMLLSIIVGAVRGAIREVMNIAGWVIAFILAHSFAANLAAHFADWAVEPVLRLVAAWVIIFLVVLLGVGLVSSLVTGLVKKLGLGGLDRGLGAVIGVARGALVLLVLTLGLGLTKMPQSMLWREAATTPWLEVAALYSRSLLPDSVAARIQYRSSVAAPSAPPSSESKKV
jgi:membrane protein required for colicin V production